MKAEQVAAEAAAGDTVRTAAAPPTAAPLQRRAALAGAPVSPDVARWLSRTYGNRHVSRLAALQRETATATPASPIANGYKAVSISDPRWQKVDDLLTWTRLGWEARAVMRDNRVPLAEGKDEVAAADAGRAKALVRVRLMIANPGGRASPELGPPGGVGESYEDFYNREFRRSPHLATRRRDAAPGRSEERPG